MLARRVSAEGRTRAYVGGRAATAADLRELGGRLVAFFGQHEHRKLTVAAAQLELLDGFAGADHLELRDRMAASHALVRERAAELESLRARVGARDRDLDLLRFELEEIEALAPSEEEETRWPPSASGCARSTAFGPPPAPGARPSPRRPPTRPARRCSSPRPSAWRTRCPGRTPSSTS